MVTGLDLQQAEHRGIAVYSKALLRALRGAGAELWLLTDFEPRLSGAALRGSPKEATQVVFAARVLEALNRGSSPTLLPLAATKLASRSRIARKLVYAWAHLMKAKNALFIRRHYGLNIAPKIDLSTLYDNPYIRIERLDYLDDIAGIICADNLFTNSFRASLDIKAKPIAVDLGDFDGLVTTCPLNIRTDRSKLFIQTIHDIIPLEYVQTSDHAGAFIKRLTSCIPSSRIFVSTSTQLKFNRSFPVDRRGSQTVAIQPPSLQIPPTGMRKLLEQDVLWPGRRLKSRDNSLRPFRYVLFNSSVEPRKNLLFVIRAYRQSGLAEKGIRLCVTGKLKSDDYSRAVANQSDNSILLTGYIDEGTKANLFLHALMVLSPSLVEGFGIPVLDSACIGAPIIASPSESHLEIQSLHDFERLVWICDTRKTLEWAAAMRDLASYQLASITDANQERQARLDRYDYFSEKIFYDFQASLLSLIHNSIKSETAGCASPY